MSHDDVDFSEEKPRPLPKIQLLSELRGRLHLASEMRPKPSVCGGVVPSVSDVVSERPVWSKPVPFSKSTAAPCSHGGSNVRRKAKAPTEERLWTAALYHLSQREMSSADLRRLLYNKVRWFAEALESAERAAVESEGASCVEAVVARAVREQLVDDVRFSRMKIRGWRERGWGERRIVLEMRRKGLPVDLVQDALRVVDGEVMAGIEDVDVVQKEADRLAAEILCRRKRIGPFRKENPSDPSDRAKMFRREMGVLARAGFGVDVILDLLGRPLVGADGWGEEDPDARDV